MPRALVLAGLLLVVPSARAGVVAPAAAAGRAGVPSAPVSLGGIAADAVLPFLTGSSPLGMAPSLTVLAAPAPSVSPVRAEVAAPGSPVPVLAAAKPVALAGTPLSVLRAASAETPAPRDAPAESAKQVADAAFDLSVRRDASDAVIGAPSAAVEPLAVSAAEGRPAEAGVPGPPAASKAGPRRFVWPALVGTVWVSWAAMMTAFGHWGLFAQNWFMSVTMAFGSFVAGATSEGSGSISFPVMTLLFHIPPAVARAAALMILAVGMTTAALTILALRIPVEKGVLLWGILGGAIGMALGSAFIAPLFAPAFAKMFFTSLWAAFAISHFMAARRRGAAVERLEPLGKKDVLAMLAFGVAGGIVSSIVGTGLCMVMFTLLTLGYRLSEKVATPTSVILMASNAVFGFLWKGAVLGGMAAQAWDYWWVCVPIVVVGAPLGARFIASRSRGFVTKLLYAAISIQLVAALLIVPQTPLLLAASAATFLTGVAIFRAIARRGDAAAGRA